MKPFPSLTCLAAGHFTHDRYGDTLKPGGSVLYAARTLLALGGDVGIASAVGEDFQFSGETKGARLYMTPGRVTTVFENTYPENAPRLMLVEDVAKSVLPDGVPGERRGPDVLFLAPVIGEIPLELWLSAMSPRVVGLGLQGFLKQRGEPYRGRACSHLLTKRDFSPTDEVLQRISAVFLSREDIEGYADAKLLFRLKKNVAVTVITDGEEGARIFTKGTAYSVGIYKTNTVDPTGAGDTFAAAFLYAFASGRSIPKAAQFAAAAASIVVEATGPESMHRIQEAFDRAPKIQISKIANDK